MMRNWLARARFRSRLARFPVVWLRQRRLLPEDALLVSYPRSGTTWLRFLLSEALTGRSAEFDPEAAAVPYVGGQRRAPAILPHGGRLLFSHETIAVGDRKVIYIARDPRAVAVSEFHWLERRGLAPSSLDRFVVDFIRGRSNPWGQWGRHVETWLASEAARSGHLCVVRFEDLVDDARAILSSVLDFLAVSVDGNRIDAAVENNSFARMKEKEKEAPDQAFAARVHRDKPFVRTGEAAAWSSTLTEQQAETITSALRAPMRRVGYGAQE
jgi:hypothetical protein